MDGRYHRATGCRATRVEAEKKAKAADEDEDDELSAQSSDDEADDTDPLGAAAVAAAVAAVGAAVAPPGFRIVTASRFSPSSRQRCSSRPSTAGTLASSKSASQTMWRAPLHLLRQVQEGRDQWYRPAAV